MAKTVAEPAKAISRSELADLLNEDLAREYQAIIAYTVYSQVLKGAQYMNIADQLQTHAQEELKHALIISRQVDYLGKMPTVTPKPVKTSDDAKTMLRFDLENENETIINYRQRVRQCEALGEYAMAEQIRQILIDEQDHQIDLATALGEDVPDLTKRTAKESEALLPVSTGHSTRRPPRILLHRARTPTHDRGNISPSVVWRTVIVTIMPRYDDRFPMKLPA